MTRPVHSCYKMAYRHVGDKAVCSNLSLASCLSALLDDATGFTSGKLAMHLADDYRRNERPQPRTAKRQAPLSPLMPPRNAVTIACGSDRLDCVQHRYKEKRVVVDL